MRAKKTGIVGPVSNIGEASIGVENYSEFDMALRHGMQSDTITGREVLTAGSGAVMIKGELFKWGLHYVNITGNGIVGQDTYTYVYL